MIRALFKESSAEDSMKVVFNYAYAICFLISFMKSYVVDTHLNCLSNSNEYLQHMMFIKKWITVDGL